MWAGGAQNAGADELCPRCPLEAEGPCKSEGMRLALPLNYDRFCMPTQVYSGMFRICWYALVVMIPFCFVFSKR